MQRRKCRKDWSIKVIEVHTLVVSRMESDPELLQWREEGVKPPHLEKKWVLALMVGEREWEYIREIE